MRQYSVKSQHSRHVTQLRFRPNSAELTGLTGRLVNARNLVAWDLASGKSEQLKHFRGEIISSFDYSPDGTQLAAGDVSGIATIYEVPGYLRLDEFHLVSGQQAAGQRWRSIAQVAFSPSSEPRNQWVVAISNEIQLRNIKTREVIAAFDLGLFEAVAFTPSGDAIVVIEREEAELISWTIKPVRERFRIKIDRKQRTNRSRSRLAISPDGETIAVTEGNTIRLVNAVGELRGRIPLTQPPHDFVFLPGNNQLAVADGGNTIKIFDIHTCTQAQEFDWGIGTVYCLTVHPDGTIAAAGGENGQVVVWDLDG